MRKIGVLAALIALVSSISMGALVVYDSFSDSVQTNWSDPSSVPSTWVCTNPIPNAARPYDNHSQIVEGSLDYPGFAASAGNSWTTHQGSDDFIKDISGITGLNPGDTVYYSFLLKVNPSDAANAWYIRLYNTANLFSSGLPVSFGLSTDLTQIGFSVGSRNGKYSDTASATLAKTDYIYNSSDTFLIVAGYSRGTTAATSSMNLWVNPDPATFSTGIPPTPTLSVAGYSSGYTTQERTWNRLEYNFNGSATGTTSGQTIDELRVGTAWADMISTSTAAPEPPVAAFTVSPTNGLGVATLTSFTFNDSSTGSVTNRYWDFGDGATTNLTGASVQHIYSSAGTYSVMLTAIGPAGSDSLTKTDLITVSNPVIPTASFTVSKTSGYAPLLVTFTGTSSGTITNRYWDFGDGSTTNLIASTVSHTYAAAGTYTVALTASGPAGSDTSTQTDLITAIALPPGTFVMESDVADNTVGIDSNGVKKLGWSGQTTLNAGDNNYDPAVAKGDQCGVVVFRLPDLGGKALNSANLDFDVWAGFISATNYPIHLDVYGVRYAASSAVSTNDYGYMGSGSGSLIQDNVVAVDSNVSNFIARVETDASGDAALLAWIADQYTAGAVAGDYVFLRLETDDFCANPWSIASGDNTDSTKIKPTLTLTTGGGSVPPPPAPIVGLSRSGDQGILSWTPATGSGYVYSVWYSTNLLAGFVPLATNLPDTVNSVTNTLDPAVPAAFYQIKAQ